MTRRWWWSCCCFRRSLTLGVEASSWRRWRRRWRPSWTGQSRWRRRQRRWQRRRGATLHENLGIYLPSHQFQLLLHEDDDGSCSSSSRADDDEFSLEFGHNEANDDATLGYSSQAWAVCKAEKNSFPKDGEKSEEKRRKIEELSRSLCCCLLACLQAKLGLLFRCWPQLLSTH